jgi:hypothetical protein
MNVDRAGVAAPENDVGRADAQVERPRHRAAPHQPQGSARTDTERGEPLAQRQVAVDGRDRGFVAGEEFEQGGHGRDRQANENYSHYA